jgi:hypothetical protein
MPVSRLGSVTRAFVSVLLLLAKKYDLVLAITRDSSPTDLQKAYRKVALKAHPDKGGSKTEAQQLNAAKENWDKERKTRPQQPGRPCADPGGVTLPCAQRRRNQRREYRVNAAVVLLTYHGVANLEHWHIFLAFVRGSMKKWGVKKWCATLEACETGALHTHLALQFSTAVDRTSNSFAFEGRPPNVNAGDYLGEGFNGKRHQQSVNRGFFYVFANKVGTQKEADGVPCFEGNHVPVWVAAKKGQSRYAVLGKWCETLWKERKLDHGVYKEYLYLTRDGVQARKRNLEEVRRWEGERAEAQEREAATQRVKAKLRPFDEVPAAIGWLALFSEERDRYPFLVVLAPSRAGKTEWAKSLFRHPLVLQVGDLEHFPDGLRNFERGVHDGIVLDDLRDFSFCVRHQEKLQGKVDNGRSLLRRLAANTPSRNGCGVFPWCSQRTTPRGTATCSSTTISWATRGTE